MPLWLYWLLYSEDSKPRCFEIYSFLEPFHKQFWRSIEDLINCHPRRFEGNAGKGRVYFEPWKCKLFSSTMRRKNYPFPSREDLWNTEVEIPSSAILRFLDIITKLLRSICSSLQSLPEDNFSKNWNFMIVDIIPDTISWLKWIWKDTQTQLAKQRRTSSIPKILILWYFDIYSCLILRIMLNLIQSQSSHF